MEKRLISVVSILAILLSSIRPSCSDCSSALRPGSFTGMFVFGNSIVDNGNNNLLMSGFKANYLPYGIDFPLGSPPTGRFTNGKNQADLIADHLKLPLLSSFSDARTKDTKIGRGVSHASAGSGILDSTGSKMGVVSLNQQIRDFVGVTLPMLKTQQGCSSTNLLEQYLFLFSTGFNDFLETFFQGDRNIGTLEYFSTNLTSNLATQITELYNAGARKFAFIDIGPFGCTPVVRAAMPDKACNETLNYGAYHFNTQLTVMLNKIKSRMPGFQFVTVNSFQIGLEFIRYPTHGGFTDVSSSCCEVSTVSGGVLCKEGGNVCTNRSTYLYFDGLNPSEALNRIVAAKAYNSSDPTEVFPFNILKLSQL